MVKQSCNLGHADFFTGIFHPGRFVGLPGGGFGFRQVIVLVVNVFFTQAGPDG
jgi:hypothetical protein